MKDEVAALDEPRHRVVVADIGGFDREPVGGDVGQVLALAVAEVVDHGDGSPGGDQLPRHLIADEARAAGDQDTQLCKIGHARIRFRAPATSSTWASVISGYIGSESSRSPCSSDAGKSPFL